MSVKFAPALRIRDLFQDSYRCYGSNYKDSYKNAILFFTKMFDQSLLFFYRYFKKTRSVNVFEKMYILKYDRTARMVQFKKLKGIN